MRWQKECYFEITTMLGSLFHISIPERRLLKQRK
tara:strand:- start:348 stop:449 length:102 start_codon:yes stop_codon:yes gene_type:complete